MIDRFFYLTAWMVGKFVFIRYEMCYLYYIQFVIYVLPAPFIIYLRYYLYERYID